MVYTLYHQEAGTGFLIEGGQCLGIQTIRFPGMQYLLIAHLRRMTVTLHMLIVSLVSLLVETTGIPVATLTGGLRTKVNPKAYLGIAQPLRSTRIIAFD